MNKFQVYATNENGYDVKVNKYYVTLSLYLAKTEYNVIVQCDDYTIATMEPTNLTIEFLDDRWHNKVMAYDKALFDEIEVMACGLFEEMKDEEKSTSGAV